MTNEQMKLLKVLQIVGGRLKKKNDPLAIFVFIAKSQLKKAYERGLAE